MFPCTSKLLCMRLKQTALLSTTGNKACANHWGHDGWQHKLRPCGSLPSGGQLPPSCQSCYFAANAHQHKWHLILRASDAVRGGNVQAHSVSAFCVSMACKSQGCLRMNSTVQSLSGTQRNVASQYQQVPQLASLFDSINCHQQQ